MFALHLLFLFTLLIVHTQKSVQNKDSHLSLSQSEHHVNTFPVKGYYHQPRNYYCVSFQLPAPKPISS